MQSYVPLGPGKFHVVFLVQPRSQGKMRDPGNEVVSSYLSMTHRLLINYYTARKRHFLLSCIIFFSFVILLYLLDVFSLYLKFLLTSRRKVLITNTDDSQLCNLQNWTTLTRQLARCGSTTNGKETLENLMKVNFHVLLKLKRINLETSVWHLSGLNFVFLPAIRA